MEERHLSDRVKGPNLDAEQFSDPEAGGQWPGSGGGYAFRRHPPRLPTIDDTVRAPLEYSYTATDIVGALPRSAAVDIAALPADLQRKARAHGDTLADIGASGELTRRQHGEIVWSEIARAGRIVGPLAKYGALLCASIATAAMVARWWRGAESLSDVLVASPLFSGATVALAGVAAVVAIARRRARRAPQWVYTKDELATLDAAAIDWPAVPEELDRYANAETLRREWHNRWLSRIHPGAAALVWPEPHLVAVAALIGRDIRASATWNSDLLDAHRVRVDLDETLDDVYLRAHRIWRARANLVPPPTGEPSDLVARRNDEIADAASDAWSALTDLVRQLQDYHRCLDPIDRIFAEITALQQSSIRVTDAAVRQLHVDAAGSDLHADAINEATVELADLNANLAARLAILRQSLTASTNGLTLTAP